jgi:hypothetical protein
VYDPDESTRYNAQVLTITTAKQDGEVYDPGESTRYNAQVLTITTAVSQYDPSKIPILDAPPCNGWMSYGVCNYGGICRYSHEKHLKGICACAQFLKDGQCGRGDHCQRKQCHIPALGGTLRIKAPSPDASSPTVTPSGTMPPPIVVVDGIRTRLHHQRPGGSVNCILSITAREVRLTSMSLLFARSQALSLLSLSCTRLLHSRSQAL